MTLTQSPPRTTTSRAHAVLLMALWIVLLTVLADVSVRVQVALGVPWEVLSLVMLAPAVCAAAVAVIGRRRLPRPWPAVPAAELVRPVLLALLFVAVFTTATALMLGRVPTLPGQVAGVPVWAFVVLQAIGAFGEEIGWRGLMQRLGETLAPPPVVTLALGVLFGATHLGLWGRGPVFMAWFTASSVLMCLAMALVWRGSVWQRMIPATVIHSGCNLAVFAVVTDSAMPGDWRLVLPGTLALMAVVLVGSATGARAQRVR